MAALTPKGIQYPTSGDNITPLETHFANLAESADTAIGEVALPIGGLDGQILAKASDTDYDTEWIDNYAPDTRIIIKNDSGVTLTRGTPVMAVGATGDRIRVAKAVADGSIEPRYMLGVMFEDVADGTEGYLVVTGEVSHINTSAYTLGDLLYLDPNTPGTFTTTEPTSPDLVMAIAIVTRSHAVTGRIFVRMWAQQSGLHELHDVALSSVADNEVLAYDSASSLWKNQTAAEAGLVAASGDQTIAGNKTFVNKTYIKNTAGYGAAFTPLTNDLSTFIITPWRDGVEITDSQFYYDYTNNRWVNEAHGLNNGNLEVTGALNANGGLVQDGHTILNGSDSWLRTNGDQGIYFASYGGGWHMNDTSWIKAYNGKSIYSSANIQGDGYAYFGGNTSSNDFTTRSGVVYGPVGNNRIIFANDGTNAFQVPAVWSRTASGTANVVVNSAGTIYRSSSASKYKLDIQEKTDCDFSKVLDLKPKEWFDKGNTERHAERLTKIANGEEVGDLVDSDPIERVSGLIAEDLIEVGLEDYVTWGDYKEDGTREPEGIQYDRLWTCLIPVVKQQKEQIASLEARLTALENK